MVLLPHLQWHTIQIVIKREWAACVSIGGPVLRSPRPAPPRSSSTFFSSGHRLAAMAQDHTKTDEETVPQHNVVDAPPSNGGVLSPVVRPQELQNMRLIVDVGDGRTIEIPLRGHLMTLSQTDAIAMGAAAGEQDAKANKFLTDMSGWMITVATLFVGISFQAMNQRPSWMPDTNKDSVKSFFDMYRDSYHDSTQKLAARAFMYILLNTVTFSISLAVVVMLLLPKKYLSAQATVRTVRRMMMLLAITTAMSFSLMTSKDGSTMLVIFMVMLLYGLFTVVILLGERCVKGQTTHGMDEV